MDHFRAMEVSAAGLMAQKARVEAAALNLANMNVTRAAGEPGYVPVTAVIRSQAAGFEKALAATGGAMLPVPRAELVPQVAGTPRRAYEPGHPDADADGMVSYPAVNHAQEMMTVTAALRSYEANLAVMHVTKTLATKALEIGGQ
jgi:flagellar basal-body rod protein FlgC